MNKQDAIAAMQQGKIVRHRFFGEEEWITMNGSYIVFENKLEILQSQFWADRTVPEWEDDWEILPTRQQLIDVLKELAESIDALQAQADQEQEPSEEEFAEIDSRVHIATEKAKILLHISTL